MGMFRSCRPAWVAAGLPALMLASAGLAQTKTFCSEPVTPFCVNQDTVYEDDAAKDRCLADVEQYVRGLDEFVECLGKQQQEARDRGTEMKARFECMEQGRNDCR